MPRRAEALDAIGNGSLHTADEEESVFPRLRGKVSEEDQTS